MDYSDRYGAMSHRQADVAATLRQAELDAHTRRRYVERARGSAPGLVPADRLFAGVTGSYPFAPEPDRFGSEPPAGAVLRWEGSSGATLVATHHPDAGADCWEITGDDVGYSWSEIADRIGNRRAAVAIGWRDIPTREPAPQGDDAVRDWAAGFLTPQSNAPADLVDADPMTEGPVVRGKVEYHADGRHRHMDGNPSMPLHKGESHEHYVKNVDGSRSVQWHDHEDGPNVYGWSIPESLPHG